jgi:hypothetical protein
MDEIELNRWDFTRWMIEYGFDQSTLETMIQNESDQIAMQKQFDAVYVGESKINGKAIFAARDIKKGELIAPARIDKKRTPCGRFTNHSVNPNSMFVLTGEPKSDILMVATRDIKANEEVLMCYRQAGAQNGNGHHGCDIESANTIIERLGFEGYEGQINKEDLISLIKGIKQVIGYAPHNLIISKIFKGYS